MLIGKASDCSDGLAEWMGAECLETVPVGVASMGMMEGVISEGSEMADATGGACDEGPGEGDTREDGSLYADPSESVSQSMQSGCGAFMSDLSSD
jgi:hypothetical protein